jgi:hypothetical protein
MRRGKANEKRRERVDADFEHLIKYLRNLLLKGKINMQKHASGTNRISACGVAYLF